MLLRAEETAAVTAALLLPYTRTEQLMGKDGVGAREVMDEAWDGREEQNRAMLMRTAHHSTLHAVSDIVDCAQR